MVAYTGDAFLLEAPLSRPAAASASTPLAEAASDGLGLGDLMSEASEGSSDTDVDLDSRQATHELDVSESDEELALDRVTDADEAIATCLAEVAVDCLPQSPPANELHAPAKDTNVGAAEAAGGGAKPPEAPAFFGSSSSYPDDNLPPKTGIGGVTMLLPPPALHRSVPTEPELLYVMPESLFDKIVQLEAERISKPQLVQNLIVYDSVEPNPTAQPQTADGVALAPPAMAAPGAPNAGRQEPATYYVPRDAEDTTLVFESRFESGNLRRAVKVYDFEYDLVLNPDFNTKSHTQWYYFRIGNTRSNVDYRFNLINMVKPTSVYNEGMRPLMYSTKEAESDKIGWVRGGESIIYYQNGVRRKDKGGTHYYTLTFSFRCKHDNDAVYFAHCYPYSYTDLQQDLQRLEADPNMSRRFRRRKLCDTLAGNACDLITITTFCSDTEAIRQRKAVVITARVHPGESNASWVMKGMLDYLTGSSLDARILRDNFVFKIIPMLNPDGVVVGNYRCSLSGQDLNRQWGEPSRKLHPTIYFAKNMMRHLSDDREIILYVDIHGHSRKKNVFMYGNSDVSAERSGFKEKIFPRLLCRSSDCFNFDDCCFKMQKSKDSTARVVVYRELSVLNSYTLEASFCGADFGPLGDQHFTTRHLEEMGYMVCDAILDFCDPDQSKVMMVCKELQVLFPDDGNSDDVSDSDVDEAALQRARRRSGKQKKGKKDKDKDRAKKKKLLKDSIHAEGESDTEPRAANGSKGSAEAQSPKATKVVARKSASVGPSSRKKKKPRDDKQGG